MKNVKRSAKSASNWTMFDLLAYNISVSSDSQERFYGIPPPTVSSLSSDDPHLDSDTLSPQEISDKLMPYLDLVTRPQDILANKGSHILQFTRQLLDELGYERSGPCLLITRHAMPLHICGDPTRSAKTSVSLVQLCSKVALAAILLVVQTATNGPRHHDPEPQVIAEAIAAFQWNNRARVQLGRPELDNMTMPCITMIGTQPTFYLVPVTRELSEAVATAQYPRSPTVVRKCVVASDGSRPSEGVENPDFRQLALQHFTAFRTLAERHWSAFKVDEGR